MKYKVELKIKIPVVVEVEADNVDLAYQNAKIKVGQDITEYGMMICSSDLGKIKIKSVRFELSKEEATKRCTNCGHYKNNVCERTKTHPNKPKEWTCLDWQEEA